MHRSRAPCVTCHTEHMPVSKQTNKQEKCVLLEARPQHTACSPVLYIQWFRPNDQLWTLLFRDRAILQRSWTNPHDVTSCSTHGFTYTSGKIREKNYMMFAFSNLLCFLHKSDENLLFTVVKKRASQCVKYSSRAMLFFVCAKTQKMQVPTWTGHKLTLVCMTMKRKKVSLIISVSSTESMWYALSNNIYTYRLVPTMSQGMVNHK